MKTLVLDPFPSLVCEVSRSATENKISLDQANLIQSNNKRTVFVKRPHLHEFLERVSKLFILVIVTTRAKVSATNVIKVLEAGSTQFNLKLYCHDCKKTADGKRVKDLRALPWPVDQIIAVDNSYRFEANSENVVVVRDFGLDDNDQELLKLLPLLERLAMEEVTDVRPVILDHHRQGSGLISKYFKATKRIRVQIVSTTAPEKKLRQLTLQQLLARRSSKADKGKSVIIETEVAEEEPEVVVESDMPEVVESDMPEVVEEQPEMVEEQPEMEVEAVSVEDPRGRIRGLARILSKNLRNRALEMKNGYTKVDSVLKLAGYAPGSYKVSEVMRAIRRRRLRFHVDENGVLHISNKKHKKRPVNRAMDNWFEELSHFPFAVFGTTNEAAAEIVGNGFEESRLVMALPNSKEDLRMQEECEASILVDFRSAAIEGIEFFITENGLLLTDNAIPPEYLVKF